MRALSAGLTVSLAALLLAACDPNRDHQDKGPVDSPAVSQPPAATPASPAAPAPAASADSPTTGGDGSAITLNRLTEADLTGAALAGELACAFAGPDKATLLLAKGDVKSKEAARGVVKVGDYVEPVFAPGGFDGMLKGASFSGQGKTVIVAVTGPATGGGESPPNPATLTYQRADGASRVIPGTWTCGP